MYQVFLVDDEPWNIMALKKLINWNNLGLVICGEADNGELAWERIQYIKPTIVISDIRMPNLSGISLLNKIRESRLDIEVIFVSGFAEFDYAQEALRLNSFDYLLKPVEASDLIETLERLKIKLDKKYSVEENEEIEQYLSNNAIVEKTLNYIEENISKKLLNRDLATIFNLSENYYATLIKKQTGKSIQDHILSIRIQKSEELLRTTNMSIAEIADQVGYSDYFYFVKVYKRATGLSPAAYRKKL